MDSVVVYGPQGCGKTRNAEALARHYGCAEIVDEFDTRSARLRKGALHLVSAAARPDDLPPDVLVVDFRSIDLLAIGAQQAA